MYYGFNRCHVIPKMLMFYKKGRSIIIKIREIGQKYNKKQGYGLVRKGTRKRCENKIKLVSKIAVTVITDIDYYKL